jgi:integrase
LQAARNEGVIAGRGANASGDGERERLKALFVIALPTGMREGELLVLRWADSALDTGTLVQSERRYKGLEKGLSS